VVEARNLITIRIKKGLGLQLEQGIPVRGVVPYVLI